MLTVSVISTCDTKLFVIAGEYKAEDALLWKSMLLNYVFSVGNNWLLASNDVLLIFYLF